MNPVGVLRSIPRLTLALSRRGLLLSSARHEGCCGCHRLAHVSAHLLTRGSRKSPLVFRASGLSSNVQPDEEYDLIVIGGGSGGLACAKQAAELGAKCCVLDYVTPSAMGTRWGLGGTCVNVGCIPKKLFHEAALLRRSVGHATAYGWRLPGGGGEGGGEGDAAKGVTLDWSTLVGRIQQHVKSLNWGHRVQLKDKRVDYYNALASFVGRHLVKAKPAKGKEKILHGKNIVIAVGGRPNYPGVEGDKELCITSDDVFSMKESPGKSLVVGASCSDVSLETAGFLNGLGFDTTVMIRSTPLKAFDQEMAKHVVQHMESEGVKVLRRCQIRGFKEVQSGDGGRMVEATWTDRDGVSHSEAFKTVMLAVGRSPMTAELGLDVAGVEFDPKSGKVIGREGERTNVDHIYAIGDVLEGVPELTPVAIKAGRFLAERLFGEGDRKFLTVDYVTFPTTVFTPLEFGSCGLSEENAVAKFGEDNLEIYHAFYKPLEFYIPEENAAHHYIKIVAMREKPQKVIGLHFLGPSAGEVIQGYYVAMKAGLTMSILEGSFGIHPTVAEEIVKMKTTKRSGIDPTVTGC